MNRFHKIPYYTRNLLTFYFMNAILIIAFFYRTG